MKVHPEKDGVVRISRHYSALDLSIIRY